MTVPLALTRLWFLDTLVTIHISHTAGSDTISLLEHQAPLGHSPPRHIHRTEDELFQVLTGDFEFEIGARVMCSQRERFCLPQRGFPTLFGCGRRVVVDGSPQRPILILSDLSALWAGLPRERNCLRRPDHPPQR